MTDPDHSRSGDADSVIVIDNRRRREVELEVLQSPQGPDVISISSLYKDLGYFTYDPGFTATASCDSAITFFDGEKGILQHRGYSIEDLASHSNYLEVAYLLMVGELPNELKRAGIGAQNLNWIELNEAIASQSLTTIRELGLDEGICESLRWYDCAQPSAGRSGSNPVYDS